MLRATLLNALDGGDASTLISDITAALGTAAPVALERATALYVWKGAWESALPASRHGGDRKSAAFREMDQSEKISFCSIASKATGLGERSIQLDIALAEDLGPASIKRLWDSPIKDNGAALKAVAKLDEVSRACLYTVWVDNPKLGFGAAMQAARLRAAEDTDEASFRALVAGWTRAGSKARRRFLDEIGVDKTEAAAVVASWRKRGTGN